MEGNRGYSIQNDDIMSRIAVAFPILLSFIGIINALPTPTATQCMRSCPKTDPNKLNVHLICHSHDDLGWLKTVDQYYIGSNPYDAKGGVQYIIDSVVENLLRDSSRKFIWVETGFFWMWWTEQNNDTKKQVKELVNQGRLEFISGGWSMNDEGAAHYNAIIDQMTWGFRRLKDIFGDCALPRIGWQIDPFGHSREQASLFAQMGFDGLFVGRIDDSDKRNRQSNKNMEFMWKASPNLGQAADLFTGVLNNMYQPPDGFCFDVMCNDAAIQDNPALHDYNVDSRAKEFISVVNDQAKNFATNNILVTMGNDFHYQQAGMWYKNLDRLMKYINAQQSNDSQINVLYSTPSCYLEALNQANKVWQVKTDDFFPYASDSSRYWTGYFTSRPAMKQLVRMTNNFLQVCKQLDTLARLGPAEHVTRLREVMGVLQHHDAITGTSKQTVAQDYVQRLSEGNAECQIAINDAYSKLMAKSNKKIPPQQFCWYGNVSICPVSQSEKSFTVTVYNPTAHMRIHHVRFPVANDSGYSVLDPDGKMVESQLVPVPAEVVKAFKGASYELLFVADLPPLGYKTFFVSQTDNSTDQKDQQSSISNSTKDKVVISNKFLQVEINATTGVLQAVTNLEQNITLPISQQFLFYPTMDSGVYAIRTEEFKTKLISSNASIKIIKGNLVQEVHQTISSWVSQVIRLYSNSKELEFQWLIGPTPSDGDGKEVITRFNTNLKNNAVFYTDSNGREMIKRVRNYRETWKVDVSEQPVSGNYYPVNSRISMQDTTKGIQMTLLPDRSQGGSSIYDGTLELLLQRWIDSDDGGGTGEGVTETDSDGKGLIFRGKIRLLVDSIANANRHHREVGQRILMWPWYTFSPNQLSPQQWNETFRSQFSGMKTSLPTNVHLLTLEQWTNGTVLLRLEHYFEKTDDPKNMSQPATVDLQALFTPFSVVSATEMSLGANRLLSSLKRLKWKTTSPSDQKNPAPVQGTSSLKVVLNPMQIRTFILTVKST